MGKVLKIMIYILATVLLIFIIYRFVAGIDLTGRVSNIEEMIFEERIVTNVSCEQVNGNLEEIKSICTDKCREKFGEDYYLSSKTECRIGNDLICVCYEF